MKTKFEITDKVYQLTAEREDINTPGKSRLFGMARHHRLEEIDAQLALLKWILEDE